MTMRFMVFVPGNADSEAGVLPPKELVEKMTKFNTELVKAGVMLAGDGLHPTSKAVKIKYDGGKRTVIDGPFSESKELVAGYWILQAKSIEEIVEWMKRAPFDGGVEIQIRPIFDPADFAQQIDPSGKLNEVESNLRKQIEQQKK
jgi:hypothetical protein